MAGLDPYNIRDVLIPQALFSETAAGIDCINVSVATKNGSESFQLSKPVLQQNKNMYEYKTGGPRLRFTKVFRLFKANHFLDHFNSIIDC